MTVQLRLRRDTSVRWASKNPILFDGEPGFEKDTGLFKIGNGVTSWNNLDYFINQDAILELIDNLPGGGGSGESNYEYTRSTPAATWIIDHNLGFIKEPVILLSTAPTIPVWTDVIHGSINQTTIIFPTPVSGKAYF